MKTELHAKDRENFRALTISFHVKVNNVSLNRSPYIISYSIPISFNIEQRAQRDYATVNGARSVFARKPICAHGISSVMICDGFYP